MHCSMQAAWSSPEGMWRQLSTTHWLISSSQRRKQSGSGGCGMGVLGSGAPTGGSVGVTSIGAGAGAGTPGGSSSCWDAAAVEAIAITASKRTARTLVMSLAMCFSSLGSPPLKHSKCLYLYRVFVFSVWDWFWALQHYTHDTVHWLISGKIVFFDEFTVSLFINIVCSVNGLLACWRTKTTACWSRDFSELIHARAQTFYWLCVVGCLILCSWLMKNRM